MIPSSFFLQLTIDYFVKTSKMQQSTLCFMITDIARRTSCDDYNVQTIIEHVFMQSVAFPDQPGQMMSDNTVSNFFTDGYAKTISFCMIFQNIHYQITVRIGFSLPVHFLEITVLF